MGFKRYFKVFVFVSVFVLSALLPDRACAQRTVLGQFFVSGHFVDGVYPPDKKVIGGEFYVGQYRGNFYWMGGLQYTPAWERSEFGCFDVAGGAMYRLLGTRNRMLNVYAGGIAMVGIDYPRGRKALEDLVVDSGSGSIDVSSEEEVSGKTKIMVGLEPRVEFEFFPFKIMAIVVGGSAPVKVVTQQDVFSMRLYGGLRFNF